ncbi:hypothetical protein [Domibacillus indicus]|uniref:hypothetical protein n=1 Tax=Domibacillus indicus TaxID=1437523 RepID=UPI00061821E9
MTQLQKSFFYGCIIVGVAALPHFFQDPARRIPMLFLLTIIYRNLAGAAQRFPAFIQLQCF